MNPLDYQVFIIASLKRGVRPKQIANCLGLEPVRVHRMLTFYCRRYGATNNKHLIQMFGGYL